MEQRELIRRLIHLAQLDVDIAQAYQQVISQTEHEELRYNLIRFRQAHERHLARISSHIRALGGDPPRLTRDLKGLLMEGVAVLSGVAADRGVLATMRANERYIHRHYQEALTLETPPEIRTLLEEHYSDEEEHLHYLGQAIRHGYWGEP